MAHERTTHADTSVDAIDSRQQKSLINCFDCSGKIVTKRMKENAIIIAAPNANKRTETLRTM
jgi:hypothetical protein